MDTKAFVLDLFEKRVQAQVKLKASLERQQKALQANELQKVHEFAAEQVAQLEVIQLLEMTWRDFLADHFTPQQLANPPIPLIQALKFSEKEGQKLLRLQEQLQETLAEISGLKDTSRVLMERSLAFVHGMLQGIVDVARGSAVYAPRKKKTPANMLINRKL